jgi:Trk K+ transport system NAD-binding subunit
MLYEFRGTLLALAAAVVVGAVMILLTPSATVEGQRPGTGTAFYAAWMAMLGEFVLQGLPSAGHLMVLFALYPVLGFVLIGEGVVRLALLMVSRKYGHKEWTKVAASTYRDHVILCGLGRLGFRVLEQLVATGTPVVVLEKRRANPFVAQARALGVPVLIADMKQDQSLESANVRRASAILACTNDDIGNLEVAIDSRRLNPKIRVVMRLFEQQLAAKVTDALDVDVAFSGSSLAAPTVAAMALGTRVLGSAVIGGVTHVTSEAEVAEGASLAGKRVDEVEATLSVKVLARMPAGGGPAESPAPAAAVVRSGDTLVIHAAASRLSAVAAAAKAGAPA